MKYILVLLLSLAILPGCASVGGVLDNTEQWRADTAANLARLNDRILEDAEAVLCRAASKGSLDRRYGSSTELAAAYNTLCGIVAAAAVRVQPLAPGAPGAPPP